MDRTADIFLQRAFIELKAFTIPEVGTFVRPDTLEGIDHIPWHTQPDGDDNSKSLIGFLINNCGKQASEAEAIQAKIRVALRSSLKLRNQYYVPGAGTIRQISNFEDSLVFIPEPSLVETWTPAPKASIQKHDDAPKPTASNVKRYAVAGLVVAVIAIAISGFFVRSEQPEVKTSPKVIAKAPTPQEGIKGASDKQLQNTERESESATLPIVPSPPKAESNNPVVSDNAGGTSTGGSGLVRDPASLDKSPQRTIAATRPGEGGIQQGEQAPTITPFPSNQTMRGQDLDEGTGPQYHIIAASGLTKEAADRFCENINYPESCELLPVPGNPGKFRVSIFRVKGQASARKRRTFYRANGCPDCWVFPPLPKQ